MPSRILVSYIVDLILLFFSFVLMAIYKGETPNYLSYRYLTGFGVLIASWSIFSFYFRKYRFKRKYKLGRILKNILFSNLATLSTLAIFMIALSVSGYSRLMFFGTVGICTFFEIILANLYFLLIHTRGVRTDLYNPPPKAYELRKAKEAINFRDVSISSDMIREAVVNECGEEAFEFISRFTNYDDHKILFLATTTRFNVQFQPDNYFLQVVNLKRTNDIQYINKFFETVNRKLPVDGTFIGFAETKNQRKKRILKKFPPVINRIYYFLDFILKRVFPKFKFTKGIYFLLTRGENRVLTRAEILGRLYSCGFEMVDEKDIGNLFYFVVRKSKEPAYDMNPTYGPFIKLQRVGKNGRAIKVYKLRTMHPYAEYLQDYIYMKNNLQEGGKFNDDFRISTTGRFMRMFWIDELPMLLNLLKGELKLVGVRPISNQYFELYDKDFRKKRIRYKPGLVPPFYVDMPKTLEEIQASERRYLESYDKHPLRTDWVYFWKAMANILLRKARSK